MKPFLLMSVLRTSGASFVLMLGSGAPSPPPGRIAEIVMVPPNGR